MPDLPNRRQREMELAGALFMVLTDWQNRPFDQMRFAQDAQRAIVPVLVGVHDEAGRRLLSQHGASIDPRVSRGQSREWAESYASVLAGEIAVSIQNELAMGYDPTTVFGQARAEMIAITEVTRAVSAGEALIVVLLAAGVEGVQARLEEIWYTENDARVCPVCAPLHNQSKDEWAHLFPDGPPAHPRCRCWKEYKQAV